MSTTAPHQSLIRQFSGQSITVNCRNHHAGCETCGGRGHFSLPLDDHDMMLAVEYLKEPDYSEFLGFHKDSIRLYDEAVHLAQLLPHKKDQIQTEYDACLRTITQQAQAIINRK